MTTPLRGEVWLVDLNPTRGREQAGKRPVLVVSTNGFNKSPADLVVIAPITSKDKSIPWHVALETTGRGNEDHEFHHVRSRSVNFSRPNGTTVGGSHSRNDECG